MSTTQLGNAKKIIDDNYEENPNSFLYDFCRNSFFCKEKFEEYLDAIGYLIAIDYQRYKFDRVKLVQINDIQAQILIYFTYLAYFTCLPFLNVASSTTFPFSS